MQLWLPLALIFTCLSSAWAVPQAVLEETLYHEFQKSIQFQNSAKLQRGFTAFEQSLYVDALWDLVEERSPKAIKVLKNFHPFHYGLVEKLRLSILRLDQKLTDTLPTELIEELKNALRAPSIDKRLIYTLAAYEEELLKAGHNDLIKIAKSHAAYFDLNQIEKSSTGPNDQILTDLFYHSPDLSTYGNGEYIQNVKLFMFCRTNRLYPCLMIMRDSQDQEVRLESGKLWHHQSLAASARGLPSYKRNGNTPAGILTIDSVMPYADQQLAFGKFRRLILNFIPSSENESLYKSLLPASSLDQDWWKASIVARDVGRNLLRIHGTGRINRDPTSPFYPFRRTNGCISQKENTYDGITYKDQRNLLDQLMVALELDPLYENETRIKGLLYVVEIDDKKAPVTLEDLALRGIQ